MVIMDRVPLPALGELNERSRDIFREIVEAYLESGAPVGSRTLSRRLSLNLSPASIRNVMADLEAAGLLYAPHTSAGRLPTQRGLRIFIDGLLELGSLADDDRERLDARCRQTGRSLEYMLEEVSDTLSGLSRCAGLVIVPTTEAPLKHIEFVSLAPGRALAIIVTESGAVENRVLQVPPGLPPSTLHEAANYLNARLRGLTLSELREEIAREQNVMRQELDELSAKVVQDGLATWAGDTARAQLIVRGRSNLLEDVNAAGDLERIRKLFDDLEGAIEFGRLLDQTDSGDGVRIFVGAENKLFSLSGSSLIVAPYADSRQHVIGAGRQHIFCHRALAQPRHHIGMGFVKDHRLGEQRAGAGQKLRIRAHLACAKDDRSVILHLPRNKN